MRVAKHLPLDAGLDPRTRGTILVVEDDAAIAYMLSDVLTSAGYLVREAATGAAARGMVEHVLPNLIILDIHVPGSNGIEILQKLKENPMTEDIPVIVLTGDTSGRAVIDTYKSRANGFISKPLNLEQVHQVIETGWGWPNDKIPQ